MAIKSYELNGKKLYEVYVNGFDRRGQRIQMRKRSIETRKRAEKVEFDFEFELRKLRGEKMPLTWSEWFAKVLGQIRLEFMPSTVMEYESCLNTWVTPRWKDKLIKDITKQDVYDIVYREFDCQLSPNSRRNLLKYIRRVFNTAVEQGELNRNPALGIKVKVPDTEQKVLNPTEVQKLLSEARLCGHKFYPIWVVAVMTGMRSGELFALKWTDIDFENRLISVTKQWTSKNGLCPTKNKHHRKVPMAAQLVKFLKELKIKSDGEFVLPRLWQWEKGQQAQILRDFCQGIGITPIKFHDLRATFITTLLARGESIGRVMMMVGHAELRTTNLYYRRAGVDLNGGTDKLGFKIPDEKEGSVLQLVL